MTRIAAIDQGTTSTRILVVDGDGPGKVVHSARHAQHHPQAGFVEHDPEELIAHIRECVAAAGTLDALGIDNQGESCLAWDSETGRQLWASRFAGNFVGSPVMYETGGRQYLLVPAAGTSGGRGAPPPPPNPGPLGWVAYALPVK